MADKTRHPLIPDVDDDQSGIVRLTRDLPPPHYTFQIKNFSLLLGIGEEKCHSCQFEVDGYQWRLVLYPNGRKNSNGKGHISLYLEIVDTHKLPHGWEVNVNIIRFFVFDQIRDRYLIIQDANGRVRHFHNLKTEWGFARLLSNDTFNNSLNGYLLNDKCVFGVEVFVIQGTGKGECLSMVNQPQRNYFTWRIDKYHTTLKDEVYYSEQFTVEGRRWKLSLYPKGHGVGVGTCLSLFLILDDSESLPPNSKVYAKYKLRLRDQIFNSNHLEKTAEYWFNSNKGYGFPEFMSLRDLKNTSKGYLDVYGDLCIECKIDVMSVVKEFSSN